MAPSRMFMQRIKERKDRPDRLRLPRGQGHGTGHGTAGQERGLKHRADNETRNIPIPLELVKPLRTHIKQYGTTRTGGSSRPPNAASCGTRPMARLGLGRGPQGGLRRTRRCRCGTQPESGDEGDDDRGQAS